MLNMGESLKVFDLERIKELAQKAKANMPSSQSQEEAKYECSQCKDEGGYLVQTDFGEAWRICNCVEKKRIARLIKSSAITEEFRKKTFGNFNKDVQDIVLEAFNTAYEYVKEFPNIRSSRNNSIALLGRPGTGKTHLLMAVSNNLLKRGIEVVYFPWVEGFSELKNDFSLKEERILRLCKAEVLYIDDMWKGRVKPTEFQLEQTYEIVNYRYMNNLPMLISSEKNFAEMCEIDEAIGSRLKEMAKGNTVTITGDISLNYRLREE